MVGWSATVRGVGLLLLGASTAFTQVAAPNSYHAVTSRTILAKPPAPPVGPAGSRFSDPMFGSPLLRVTDPSTDSRGLSSAGFATSSAAHQLAWNASSDRFYVRSISGWYFAFTFNAATMSVSRTQLPTNNGHIETHVEPQFSFRSPNILYGGTRDQTPGVVHDYPVLHQFDFNTSLYTVLINLRLYTDVAPDTYVGAISSSATLPERVAAIFGGNQDTHMKAVVFDVSAPVTSRLILDTKASTLNGAPITTTTGAPLDFFLHHAWIDKSGRYVVLYPVGGMPVPFMNWDLLTNTISPVTTRTSGHDALGYGLQVNQDCCAANAQYEGAQWQLRSLAAPQSPSDLISPYPSPRQVFIADHTSWNNAQPERRLPVLSSVYRYFNGTLNTTPWRAWDDEIVAIRTDGEPGPQVWRFAHHHSNTSRDDAIAGTNFWYQPRGVISPNGRWAMFTSNWEKTLGAFPNPGEPYHTHRTDVFIVGLSAGTFTDDPLTIKATTVKAVHFTELRTRINILRVTYGLSTYAWGEPELQGGPVKAVHLEELRTAVQQAYIAAMQPPPQFQDPAVGLIRAVHIEELRDAVTALEGG